MFEVSNKCLQAADLSPGSSPFMGACAFVASRLYTIGRKIACFTVLIADWFTRTSVAARAVCGTAKPLAKLVA